MKKPGERLPIVFVHAHITVVEPTALAGAVALRDALRKVIAEHADQFGIRIKRKRVNAERGKLLWKQYEDRAKYYELVE